MRYTWTVGALAAILIGLLVVFGFFGPRAQAPSVAPFIPDLVHPFVPGTEQPAATSTSERVTVDGYWECLPKKGPGPHTMECALGIAIDQSDGHYGINTALMSTYPVDYPTGSKVRVSGALHPAPADTTYDIDGIIWATTIERL